METVSELAERFDADRNALVWGYIRVSGESQENNESLDVQRSEIIKYCAAKNFSPPSFVEEVGSAAKPMFLVNLPGTPADSVTLEASPRPLLLLLLGHLRELPKGALLVVWRLDRLSRLSYEQELLMDMLRKAEVRVHSVQSGEDHILDGGYVHDPARVLMRQVMASYAQYERAIIELRLQSGKNYKAARGGYTGGQPPFGYAAQGKELVIDPFEAEMVRFIFKLHREFHFTPGQISEHVEKHKASHDKTKYYKLKIYRILKTERQYLGYYTDCYGHEHFRPDLTILTKDAKS